MCRLFGFRSSITTGVHRSLVVAENALAVQSVAHPDGWGLAYYKDHFPHLIRSDKQALADGLFDELSTVVSTQTLLAHIRQATVGKISVLNCHPFQYGPWTFGHNGQVSNFRKPEIRDRILGRVDARFRHHQLGTTDSEVCFLLFLTHLGRMVESVTSAGVRAQIALEAMDKMIADVRELAPDDDEEPQRLSFLVTNGNIMLGIKYRRPLHYSTYKSLCPDRDTCFAFEASRCEQEVSDGIVKHLMIASEPVAEGPNVWSEMDDGEFVYVDLGMNFSRGRMPSLEGAPPEPE